MAAVLDIDLFDDATILVLDGVTILFDLDEAASHHTAMQRGESEPDADRAKANDQYCKANADVAAGFGHFCIGGAIEGNGVTHVLPPCSR